MVDQFFDWVWHGQVHLICVASSIFLRLFVFSSEVRVHIEDRSKCVCNRPGCLSPGCPSVLSGLGTDWSGGEFVYRGLCPKGSLNLRMFGLSCQRTGSSHRFNQYSSERGGVCGSVHGMFFFQAQQG